MAWIAHSLVSGGDTRFGSCLGLYLVYLLVAFGYVRMARLDFGCHIATFVDLRHRYVVCFDDSQLPYIAWVAGFQRCA